MRILIMHSASGLRQPEVTQNLSSIHRSSLREKSSLALAAVSLRLPEGPSADLSLSNYPSVMITLFLFYQLRRGVFLPNTRSTFDV